MKEKKLKRYTYLILPVIIFNILAQIIKKTRILCMEKKLTLNTGGN